MEVKHFQQDDILHDAFCTDDTHFTKKGKKTYVRSSPKTIFRHRTYLTLNVSIWHLVFISPSVDIAVVLKKEWGGLCTNTLQPQSYFSKWNSPYLPVHHVGTSVTFVGDQKFLIALHNGNIYFEVYITVTNIFASSIFSGRRTAVEFLQVLFLLQASFFGQSNVGKGTIKNATVQYEESANSRKF